MIRAGTAIRSIIPKERNVMKRIVYEKNYDKELNIEIPESECKKSSSLPETGKEFLQMLEENSVYVPNEGKIEFGETFISNAMTIADLFEFDVKITKDEHYIQVEYKVPDCPFIGACKNDFLTLLKQADDFSIHRKSEHILLILTFHTHDHYLNGRKMHNF